MRRKRKGIASIKPDAVYGSVLAGKFINSLMQSGKKNLAEKIFYQAIEEAGKKTNKEPIKLFEEALQSVTPLVEVRSKRIGGANYQVPREVPKGRQIALATRWLIQASRNKKGRPMRNKLAEEFVNAVNKQGEAYKKKEDTRRMAEANRAFAHFGR